MKPRWKTIVELVVFIICVFIGSYTVSISLTWPPVLPQWFGVVLGVATVIVFSDKVGEAWREL